MYEKYIIQRRIYANFRKQSHLREADADLAEYKDIHFRDRS